MSRSQRLAFLGIAAAIAVVAIVVFAVSGGSDEKSTQSASPTATPSATAAAGETATPSATATAAPIPVLRSGQVKRLDFTEGDTVRFQVRSDKAEEVHVHGYDFKKDIEPGKPVTFSFTATITGIFVVEFEHAGEQIAELRVEPK
jgi:hypothetical protein